MRNEERGDYRYELDCLKLEAVIEEALSKLELLGRINESDDNSSELAGFEINKLLKEQTKLEVFYNDLINRRNKLKTIEHKAAYASIQNEINDVSRSLKESTKKLCRLFKENKNLNEDLVKVKGERDELLGSLNNLVAHLHKREFFKFEEEVIEELEGHNRLEELQTQEKELLNKSKTVKADIAHENKAFKNEINEKQLTILKLREEFNKTKTEITIRLKYKMKELETNEQTEQRTYEQLEDNLLKSKMDYEHLKLQEEKTFEKTKQFLLKEQDVLKAETEVWNKKFNDDLADMDNKVARLREAKERDTLRLEELRKALQQELETKALKEAELLAMFQQREAKRQNDSQTEACVRTIQFHFEDWFKNVGKDKKRGGKKLAATR